MESPHPHHTACPTFSSGPQLMHHFMFPFLEYNEQKLTLKIYELKKKKG